MPGASSGDLVPVELELDIKSAAPPWECGTLLEEARYVLANQEEGDLMGGPRFEQLFRATGRLRVGDEVRDDQRRRAPDPAARRAPPRRRSAATCGSRRCFRAAARSACNNYPPRTDGKPTFNEGYVFEGDGELIPARVVEAPWLDQVEPKGQNASVVLETDARDDAHRRRDGALDVPRDGSADDPAAVQPPAGHR